MIPGDESLMAMWEPRTFTICPGWTIGQYNYSRADQLTSVWFSTEVIS